MKVEASLYPTSSAIWEMVYCRVSRSTFAFLIFACVMYSSTPMPVILRNFWLREDTVMLKYADILLTVRS